jgi:PAS domain S-box-containing protein
MANNKKEKELFQIIFEYAKEAILVSDDKGFIIKANTAAEMMFGYEKGALISHKIDYLVPTKCRSNHKKHLLNDSDSIKKESTGIENKLFGQRKDGTKFPVEFSLNAATIANRKVVISYIKDTTAEEEIKNDLVEYELRKKDILQALPDLMFVVNRQGIYLEVYASDPTLLIAPIDELIGKSMCDILPEVLCNQLQSAFDCCAKTGNTQTFEYDLVINRAIVYCEARVVSNENSNFLIIVRDVTIAKKAEKTIKENEQKLSMYAIELEDKVQLRNKELTTIVTKLVETNIKLKSQAEKTQLAEVKAHENHVLYLAIAKYFPMGIIIIIDRDYKIILNNGEDLKKIGLKPASLTGVCIDDIAAFNLKLKNTIKVESQKTLEGNHVSFETALQGEHYSVNSMPLYNKNDEVERALFVFQNITKQKNVKEGILNALTKEKELNELKSRFITIASHEFRTPLSTILSSANLISRQNESGKEENREKNVQRIKSNVKDLVHILNNFLSLGKMEIGKVILEPSLFDIIKLSKTLIQEIEISKSNQPIKLVTDTVFIAVFLDKKLLRQIILNLLSNAVKYSPQNKEIIVSISVSENSLSLLVSDQGMGIPKEEMEQLFTRFFRAKNVANIQGTGLGLHIVKKYIELMEGSIAVESILNKGTFFFVTLPIKLESNEKNISY